MRYLTVLAAAVVLLAACSSSSPGTTAAGTPPSPASSPNPSPTDSPAPSPTGTAAGCTTSSLNGVCGPYTYPANLGSNGYNTYVGNNAYSVNSGTTQTLMATDPGNWSVISDSGPAGYTGVQAYPETSQGFHIWCGPGHFGGCNNATEVPVSGLNSLVSSYHETMPHNSDTDAQAAWDIWVTDNGKTREVMVWVDNVNRGDGGATEQAQATFGGQYWTLYKYGSELIWSLGAPGRFAQQSSGTVNLLPLLNYLVTNRYLTSPTIGEIDFGWEICSTGGKPETFSISQYGISRS